MGDRFRFIALQLTALMAAVFGLQVFYGFEPGFNASVSPLYKFFTSILGHSDLEHLVNNLFFIGLFGSVYERLTSGKMFLGTFFVSALFANLTAFIFFPQTVIIGASGGAFGVLAALAVYRPNQVGLALGIPLPMWAVLLIYTMTNLAGLTGSNNVAYEAHLFGMVVGSAVGLWIRDRELLESESKMKKDEEWRERVRKWEEKWMM